ncbi:capsular polysaccharide transport system permease protein [Nitrosospira multiformis]|uniref:Transport permease protein n=1 Tax=Nitrosospira multiformis TaxID=1231 RepID=A0A1H8NX05_9PROT|nr:ABC transporter permease [Nitrosospira multiformis]SEO34084.1 capsular polysaccharide transport system permease protein [Nitrosospira multiformis]
MSRSAFLITCSVWKALFLREAVSRLRAERAAWFWLLLEPVIYIVSLMVVFTLFRMRTVGGIDTAVWLMVGMLAFFMFNRTALRSMSAISANQALFAYRQVKPVDTVLVRICLEGFLMVLITIILLSGGSLFGLDVSPADPLAVLLAFFGLWLLGAAFGLIASVAVVLIREAGKVIEFSAKPVYLLSGAIFPIAAVPSPYRDWLVFNPVAHGLEAARLGFAPYYHAIPELSITYLYGCSLAALFFGLSLHQHFRIRLITQ